MRLVLTLVVLVLAGCDSGSDCRSVDELDLAPGEAAYRQSGDLGPSLSCPEFERGRAFRDGEAVAIEAPGDTLRLLYEDGNLVDALYRGRAGAVYSASVNAGTASGSGAEGSFEVSVALFDALFPVRFKLRGRFAL